MGGENGYNIDYNGTILKDKIYDGWINMEHYKNYEDTEVDEYLNEEFLNRLDPNLINNICNTELSFSEYYNGRYTNYEINRKLFLLSLTELTGNSTFDNKTKNKMTLDYFNNDTRIATNDIGTNSQYWTRTSQGCFYFIGYNCLEASRGNSKAKYGVRPAFTISNAMKIKIIYSEELNKEIYVFDI